MRRGTGVAQEALVVQGRLVGHQGQGSPAANLNLYSISLMLNLTPIFPVRYERKISRKIIGLKSQIQLDKVENNCYIS